jgi:hypothetical protein
MAYAASFSIWEWDSADTQMRVTDAGLSAGIFFARVSVQSDNSLGDWGKLPDDFEGSRPLSSVSWLAVRAYRRNLTYSHRHVVLARFIEERRLMLLLSEAIRGASRMNALHFTRGNADSHADLESAFNDDFDSAANSVGAALVRWLVLLWAAATLGVGTFVIARAFFEYAPDVLSGLGQLFS